MAHWPMPEPRRRGRCWTTSRAGWLRSPRMRRASGYPRLAPIAGVILLGAGGAGVQSERWLLTRFAERSEEHTSELQSPCNLVCRLLLEKKKKKRDMKLRSRIHLHARLGV